MKHRTASLRQQSYLSCCCCGLLSDSRLSCHCSLHTSTCILKTILHSWRWNRCRCRAMLSHCHTLEVAAASGQCMLVWTVEELAVTSGQCMPVWRLEELAVTTGQCMPMWTRRGQATLTCLQDASSHHSTALTSSSFSLMLVSSSRCHTQVPLTRSVLSVARSSRLICLWRVKSLAVTPSICCCPVLRHLLWQLMTWLGTQQ